MRLRSRLALAITTVALSVASPPALTFAAAAPAGGQAPGPAMFWDGPTGRFHGKPPKLVVIYVHGGGWHGIDRAFAGVYRQMGTGLRSIGYATVTLDFRAGATGFGDIHRFYRQVRRRVPAATPVCVLGDSSGGHEALMLAALEPGIACVVALAAPTDLTRLEGAPDSSGLRDLAERAFGADRLPEYSPLLLAGRIHARLLLATGEDDPLVAPDQARRMGRAVPGSRVFVLPPGSAPFVHTTVDPDALRSYLDARRRLFASLASARPEGFVRF